MNPDMNCESVTMTNGKGVTKTYSTGGTRPKEVYALRSSEEHDDAGVWVNVFMIYNGNTAMIVEFENGIIINQHHHSYENARKIWQVHINEGMHRDDSYIEGLPLGDVKI
tara:strand:+ start:26 stop:355 length:330 start_codon:yes stop_codon:yes gene_type:complete